MTFQFRRSLQPFQRYVVTTELDSWDQKWFYLRQTFTSGDKIYAVGKTKWFIHKSDGWLGLAKLIIKEGTKDVSLGEVLTTLGHDVQPFKNEERGQVSEGFKLLDGSDTARNPKK